MDILEKFIRKVAYKFPKGYPDINNPEDKALLEKLIGESTLFEDTATKFDELITQTFDGEVPAVKGNYQVPSNGGRLTLNSQDKEPFIKLFKVKPNAGVGNGEVSLYWLFNYKNPKSPDSKAQENRGGSDPDLNINGNGVEVKSYPSHSSKIGLGKFKEDVESRKVITRLFGVLNLTSAFEGKKEFVSEVSFNLNDLKQSFEQVLKTKAILNKEEVKSVLQNYDIFQALENQIDSLLSLVEGGTAEDLAKGTMGILVGNKLEKKPGPGNYVANLLPKDPTDIVFHKIPANIKAAIKAAPYEKVEAGTGVSSAEIQVNYNLFD
jgi:hypothetical protein